MARALPKEVLQRLARECKKQPVKTQAEVRRAVRLEERLRKLESERRRY